ncbi:MAG TPA: potassium transporter TrkG [Salinivirgaceae bacterium]|nr:potassium transporter TrkG [Salinivirgaceae bacterium]HQA75892.1 potassium transporter TrkG [Salinivirgaceae bacterium]
MLNRKFIIHILGILLIVESIVLFISALVSYYYNESDIKTFILSGSITFVVGLLFFLPTLKSKRVVSRRDGYVIVSLVWIVFSIFGCLPYFFGGYLQSFTDAFFETISGFTTTGITTVNDIESLPHGILFWRSLTQWIGGMGIIVLSLAILPFFNVGGLQLFSAEVTGITFEKIRPKLSDTAINLWTIYLLFTLLEAVMLKIAGMTTFDAICHSFTTMSTGGFSTKNSNIAYFNSPQIEYTIIAFMFISGINFSVLYYVLTFKFSKIRKNEELFFYFIITALFAIILFAPLLHSPVKATASLRSVLFHTVSIITTTGFVMSDFALLSTFTVNIVFLLLFIGSMTGSTGGGIKIIRVTAVIKNIYFEVRRIIHPRAVIPLRLNGKSIPSNLVGNILVFVIVYIIIFIIGAIALTFLGFNFETALGASLTSLSNAGPILGKVSAPLNCAEFPVAAKWIMSLLMLIGRLEIFTVLALFMPSFWKK